MQNVLFKLKSHFLEITLHNSLRHFTRSMRHWLALKCIICLKKVSVSNQPIKLFLSGSMDWRGTVKLTTERAKSIFCRILGAKNLSCSGIPNFFGLLKLYFSMRSGMGVASHRDCEEVPDFSHECDEVLRPCW